MPNGRAGRAIPLLARIVGLAQTVEVFERAFGVQTAFEVAHARRGRWFDPALVDCLDTLADDATFWAQLSHADSLLALPNGEPPTRVVFADELRMDTIAQAFREGHRREESLHGAPLAERLLPGHPHRDGTRHDLPRSAGASAAPHCCMTWGSSASGNSILDKPTPLTPTEMAEMQRHTVYTLEILRGVPRFERFAALAASHHERLDGSGYHIGLAGNELSLSVRVLAAADVCEALSANRPYRPATPIGEVLRSTQGACRRGQSLSGGGGGIHGLVPGPPAWFNRYRLGR